MQLHVSDKEPIASFALLCPGRGTGKPAGFTLENNYVRSIPEVTEGKDKDEIPLPSHCDGSFITPIAPVCGLCLSTDPRPNFPIEGDESRTNGLQQPLTGAEVRVRISANGSDPLQRSQTKNAAIRERFS
jgi:hypothetical protein